LTIKNISVFVRQSGGNCKFASGDSWVVLSEIEQRIKSKIEANGTQLKDWKLNIFRGILTGYNEAFIITAEKRNEILSTCTNAGERKKTDELIRPILRGRDIKRYGYDFCQKYLIATFPSKNYDIDEFPAVKKYLEGFKPKLKQTGEALTNQEIEHVLSHADTHQIILKESDLKASRKKTSNKWFETQDSISYWDDFFVQKIMYPNMTKFLPFYLDAKGFMQNDKSFMITGKHLSYLTAFLNSSLFKYCFVENFPELQGGTRELRKIFLDKIPVLQVSDQTNTEFEKLVEKLQDLTARLMPTKELEIEIDAKIFDLYSLTENERKTVGFIEIR
jgi:hypothetical protein